MNVSENNFSKKSFNKVTPSNRGTAPTKSSNTFAKKTMIKGNKGFEGKNTWSQEYGMDDLYTGEEFGTGEYGGISHFKTRTLSPDITH